jgi:hypothetical protein
VRVGTAVPRPLSRYLEALRAHDYPRAYALTQLAELVRTFGPGASLSEQHFAAFYGAHPIVRYRVGHIARSEVRSIDAVGTRGTPYFEATVSMVDRDGARDETFIVEDDRVQVEPARVFVTGFADPANVTIDGVPALLGRRAPNGTYTLLLLRGSHRLRDGSIEVAFATSPLSVLSGPAVVEGSPPLLVLGAR